MAILESDIGQRFWFLSSAIKAWWGDVVSLTPSPIKTLFAEPEPQWLIELGPDHLSVLEKRDRRFESAAELHDWRDQEEGLASFLAMTGILTPKMASKGIVVLQKEMLMKRTFSLPLQAEINLARLLEAQLDTLTPFTADEALVGWTVTNRHLSDRRLQVDLLLTPKAKLDGLIHIFNQATGRDPICRYRGNDASNELITLKPLTSKREAHPISTWLTATAIGLLILAQAVPISLLDRKIDSLNSQIATNQVAVSDSLAVRRKLDDLRSNLTLLSQRDANAGSSLSLLQELTRVTPDDASFDRVLQSPGTVEINGTAADAYALLGQFQDIRGVSGARFMAPVVADPKLGKHRFRLVLTLEEG
jgi:general secretion pathway protein L